MQKTYKLYHYTSIENAMNIMETKKFIPAKCYGDKGLNCFIEGFKYTPNNSIDDTSVKMNFIWNGSIQKIEASDSRDIYPEDLLIDQRPWRAHIAGPISDKALRLKSIEIDDDKLDIYLQNEFIYKYFCFISILKKSYREKFCARLNKKLEDSCTFISIKSFR